MLTCKQMTELVTDYAEGRMTFWTRVSFNLHLGMCRHCRAYVRQIKIAAKTVGALKHAPPDPAVRDELLRRFRNWKN